MLLKGGLRLASLPSVRDGVLHLHQSRQFGWRKIIHDSLISADPGSTLSWQAGEMLTSLAAQCKKAACQSRLAHE
ncbi:hypothetical protein I6F19_26765 [Ensifer sp. BRP08]|nr:hypothetical protein [Ensifer sp. BRP08]